MTYLSSNDLLRVNNHMKYILLLTISLASCSTIQKLPSGQYTGYLSQMDKPDTKTNLKYEVVHQEDSVSLQIFLPQGMNIQTKELVMTKDTLFFSFDKLDRQGSLSCALKKVNKNYYYGRCTDADGKWAVFAMKHNSLDFSGGGNHFPGFGCPCHSPNSGN